MRTATLETGGGRVRPRCAYDARLVASLRDAIPWRSLRWDVRARCWETRPKWRDRLLEVLELHQYRVEIQPPEIAA